MSKEQVREALVIAEAALADIGDADREPGDDLAWCERRAAQALPTVRAALASPAAEPVQALKSDEWQGGLTNDELRAALQSKLRPGFTVDDDDLPLFALGIEYALASPPATKEAKAGWTLVPVEPTDEMANAGARSLIDGQEQRPGVSWADEARMAYRAMLAAASEGAA